MSKPTTSAALAFATCVGLLTPALPAQESTPSATAITGAVIHTGTGEVIENGVIVFENGRITAVGGNDTAIPAGAATLDMAGRVVTPGFVDAGADVAVLNQDRNEEGTEVTPAMDIWTALDPLSDDFPMLASHGVTTVHVRPGNRNVIGGVSVILKTAGQPDNRVLKQQAALRQVMGSEPGSGNRAPRFGAPAGLYYRRPSTRMGVIWTARKAFHDALSYRERTADPAAASQPKDSGMEMLLRAIDGEVPVLTVARSEQDIRTAMRLQQEFGYKLLIEDPVDAWRTIPELKAAGAALLYGAPSVSQVGGRGVRDQAQVRWHTLTLLADAGIPFAIQTGDDPQAMTLPQEAMFAVRNGLTVPQALAAVTRVPAEILGIADRVGTLAPGKDADIVVWSGNPFSPTTRAEAVFVTGQRADG